MLALPTSTKPIVIPSHAHYQCAVIIHRNRLLSVMEEAQGWWTYSNEVEKNQSGEYTPIIKSIKNTLGSRIGMFDESEDYPRHDVVACYEAAGNVQAIATFTMDIARKTLKIHRMASAAWNLSPKVEQETHVQKKKGAGSALILALMQHALNEMGQKPCQIYLETTRAAQPFYEKMGLHLRKDFQPKEPEPGTIGPMTSPKITKEGIEDIRQKCLSKGYSSTLCDQSQLPKTILHFKERFYKGEDLSQAL